MAREKPPLSRTNLGGILGGDWGDLPDSRSGLIMGDFVIRSVPLRPLSRREMLCSYPHLFFPRKISHLAVITVESCDSGFSPALDVMAKRREVWLHSRTVLRQVWTGGPRFDIGAYSGWYLLQEG